MGADARRVIDRARHGAGIGDHDIVDAADRHQRGARRRALDHQPLARGGDAGGRGAMAGIGHGRGQRIGGVGAALDQVQRQLAVDPGLGQFDMIDDAGIGLGDDDVLPLARRPRPGLMHQRLAQRPFLVRGGVALRPAEDITDDTLGAGGPFAGIAIGRRAGIGLAGDQAQPVAQILGNAVKRVRGQGHVDPVRREHQKRGIRAVAKQRLKAEGVAAGQCGKLCAQRRDLRLCRLIRGHRLQHETQALGGENGARIGPDIGHHRAQQGYPVKLGHLCSPFCGAGFVGSEFVGPGAAWRHGSGQGAAGRIWPGPYPCHATCGRQEPRPR